MNKCEICNKEIKSDSQFINNKWYHNCCIEEMSKEIKYLNNVINNLTEQNNRLQNIISDTKNMEEETIKNALELVQNFHKKLKEILNFPMGIRELGEIESVLKGEKYDEKSM